jgi:hypothetical protein
LVRAALLVPTVALALRTLGYRRVRWALGRLPARPPGVLSVDGAVRAVQVAAARSPVRSTCLSRSLTLWSLLRSRGFDPSIHLGVARPGGTFEAHAWVECDGRSLGHSDTVPFLELGGG